MRSISFFLIVGSVSIFLSLYFGGQKVEGQTSPNQCKIYYDKSIELAEKGAKDLPAGITMDFDPRVANSNASIAYSQIHRNCKKYGE